MRAVVEGFRAMEQSGTRLIFGHDAEQWRAGGSLAISIQS